MTANLHLQLLDIMSMKEAGMHRQRRYKERMVWPSSRG